MLPADNVINFTTYQQQGLRNSAIFAPPVGP
jgi:hypothetical protein